MTEMPDVVKKFYKAEDEARREAATLQHNVQKAFNDAYDTLISNDRLVDFKKVGDGSGLSKKIKESLCEKARHYYGIEQEGWDGQSSFRHSRMMMDYTGINGTVIDDIVRKLGNDVNLMSFMKAVEKLLTTKLGQLMAIPHEQLSLKHLDKITNYLGVDIKDPKKVELQHLAYLLFKHKANGGVLNPDDLKNEEHGIDLEAAGWEVKKAEGAE